MPSWKLFQRGLSLYFALFFHRGKHRGKIRTKAMNLTKDLIFLILQFCDEENLKKTAHMLEQETGYFFDLKHFEGLLFDGNWEEAENYLSSFTEVEDDKYSTKIYFELRKQKYLEALDQHEYNVALDILRKDLKVFAESNKELYKEMAQLLALDDFREHSSLTSYGDALSARKRMVNEVKTIIEAHPVLKGKAKFPQVNKSRLRRLINQSLNWQHIRCAHPLPEPHIDSLFTDHSCPGADFMLDQLNKESSLPMMPVPVSISPFMGSTSNQSSENESIMSERAINLSNKAVADSEKCNDTLGLNSNNHLNEVATPTPVSSHYQDSSNELPKEFPSTVVQTLDLVSTPTCMEFHPVFQNLLLVGNSVGQVELWDVTCSKQLVKREFTVLDSNSVSGSFSEGMKNPGISVNRVIWSSDGSLFGVAYTMRMIYLYSYEKDGNYCERWLEIDAHVGSVNDLAFSEPNEKLLLISCGDDKLIQAWDAMNGAKLYTFEGHEAPVYSICSHVKENIHFLFSVSTNGEIKAWLFDNLGSRVTYAAPGFSCMRMAYRTDGKRLFSCGTNKQGESYLVEWNESEGFVVRNYNGLCERSLDVVRFDTTGNRYLAAGDEYLIKIWDMDSDEILEVIDADGDLPASPYLCFNKNGTLLAVSADHNQVKILASDQGSLLPQTPASVSDGSSAYLTESFKKLAVNPIPVPFQAEVTPEESFVVSYNINGKWPAEPSNIEIPNYTSKIVEVSRCQCAFLTSKFTIDPIRRLVYTNAGDGILGLAENGIHLVWKWVKSDTNLSGEATAKQTPPLWEKKSGHLMINDLPKNNFDIVTPTFSLSRNDHYVISSSGKIISLYNMLSFKKMRSVMPSPPVCTCIMFYPPDNNIIVFGMDDSSILIYNIRVDEVISELEGHSKRITGLAFSTNLNVFLSSGVDTQIVLWDAATWEKKNSTTLQISIGWLATDNSETDIQLDKKDQKHFLAVHETQLAIYETTTLRRVKQWAITNFCTRIAHATFSCDSELVYSVMRDGIVLILGALDLTPRFEIDPSAYLPMSYCHAYPIVIAAHPKKPNQFALGLTNGGVAVVEPIAADGNWSTLPLVQAKI